MNKGPGVVKKSTKKFQKFMHQKLKSIESTNQMLNIKS